MEYVAKYLAGVQPSATLEAANRARELVREGRDVVKLTTGEPDFPTPSFITEAAYQAMRQGKTTYPPVNGIPELRELVAQKLQRDNELAFDPADIIVTVGVKQALFNALSVTLNEGDEVLIPAPYWVSYPDIVRIARGSPRFIATSEAEGFKLNPESLAGAITDRTRALILNSPNNPTGTVYGRDDLLGLAEVLRQHPNILIVCDDIYEHIRFNHEPFWTLAQVAPDLGSRTFVSNGFSKAFCMTGWRLGYGAGPRPLIAAMRKYQGQSTGGATHFCQWAGVAALEGDQSFIAENNAAYRRRRDLVVERINAIDGLSCRLPEGTFYAFVRCDGLIGRKTPSGRIIENDKDFAAYLLDDHLVAVVHGAAFGLSPYIRISCASSLAVLEQGCDRIERACAACR